MGNIAGVGVSDRENEKTSEDECVGESKDPGIHI